MTDYRVLLVAPQTDLVLAKDEVDQVVNLLQPKLLSGSQATIQGLLAIMDAEYDIVWFATHGDEQGIYLNDGVVSASELTALVRASGVTLLVLNTCSSRPVALTIYDELRIDLVCTVKKVPDRMAFITGTLFARMLVRGLSYREAYKRAKPGQNSTYTFVPEEESEMPADKRNAMLIVEEPDDIVAAVRRLQIVVQGDSAYNVKGLVPTVESLTVTLNGLVSQVIALKNLSDFNRRLLWLNFGISISLLVAFMVLVFQRGIL